MFFEKSYYYVFAKYKDYMKLRSKLYDLIFRYHDFDTCINEIIKFDKYNGEIVEEYAICYFDIHNQWITLTDLKSKIDKGEIII